jgi:hypothetical protein
MVIQPCEEHPLPWRYVPLPFDGGGVRRLTYLIIAANDVEICRLSDQRTARFICAASTALKQEKAAKTPELVADAAQIQDHLSQAEADGAHEATQDIVGRR